MMSTLPPAATVAPRHASTGWRKQSPAASPDSVELAGSDHQGTGP